MLHNLRAVIFSRLPLRNASKKLLPGPSGRKKTEKMRDGARIAVKPGVLGTVRQKIPPKHDGRFILEQVSLGFVFYGLNTQ